MQVTCFNLTLGPIALKKQSECQCSYGMRLFTLAITYRVLMEPDNQNPTIKCWAWILVLNSIDLLDWVWVLDLYLRILSDNRREFGLKFKVRILVLDS